MIDPTLLYDFCSLFSGYSAAFGTYDPRELGKSNGKQKVKQHTVKEKLTKDTYKRHLEGVKPLGVVMLDKDERVSFAAIDIDVYPLNLKDLSIKLMNWKLPLLVCSSKSKGAHIFTFFETPQDPDSVINALKIVASALGHPNAEVFPKQTHRAEGAIGNFINLPFYNHPTSTRECRHKGKGSDFSGLVDCVKVLRDLFN